MRLKLLKWSWRSATFGAALIATVPAIGQDENRPSPNVPQTEQPRSPVPPSTPPQAAALNDDTADASNDQYEVLMSGPVHEAFAEPDAQADARPLIVSKTPPEPIDEVPPDVQPDADDIEWIPGYWGWDQNTDDFVWVTGLWRQTPPNRQWVPGYWNQVENGFQWVSGFWADENVGEIAYLPPPPQAPEAAPSTPPPSDDYFWVPGQWSYDNTQYQWQAGYWAQYNPDWIWVNTTYLYTPQGYVYRSGYWDYQLGYRGTIFCPVRFNSGYAGSYRPNYVSNVGVNWLANLFVHPGYRHYYFGNYYGSQYQQSMYPWVSYYQGQRYYDPLYSYYQTGHRNFINQVNQQHQLFVQQQQYRPAATLKAQQRQEQELNQNNSSLAFNTATIAALAAGGHQLLNNNNNSALVNSNAAFQFKKLDKDATNNLAAALKPVKELQQQRREVERANATVGQNNTVGNANSNLSLNNKAGGNSNALANQANSAVKLKLPARSPNQGQFTQNADKQIDKETRADRTGKPNDQAGNRRGDNVTGNGQGSANAQAPGAKAGELGRGRDNLPAVNVQGRGNADGNDRNTVSPPTRNVPGGNALKDKAPNSNAPNSNAAGRQNDANSLVPGGSVAPRNNPRRGAAPNLPPVPHSPNGKAGGASPNLGGANLGGANPGGRSQPGGRANAGGANLDGANQGRANPGGANLGGGAKAGETNPNPGSPARGGGANPGTGGAKAGGANPGGANPSGGKGGGDTNPAGGKGNGNGKKQ